MWVTSLVTNKIRRILCLGSILLTYIPWTSTKIKRSLSKYYFRWFYWCHPYPHRFESFGRVPWSPDDIAATVLVIVAIVVILFATYASWRNHHLKCGAPPTTTNWLLEQKATRIHVFQGRKGNLACFCHLPEIIGINWEDCLSDILSLFVAVSLFGIPSSHHCHSKHSLQCSLSNRIFPAPMDFVFIHHAKGSFGLFSIPKPKPS
jgi:hypothetical protein